MRESPILEVQNLTKLFPGVVAVENASFSIYPGEVIGLVGKNGAGKSTLIKMLAGALKPDSGFITINETEVELNNPLDASKEGISVVYQELSNFPNMSVAENVELGLGFPRKYRSFINWRLLNKKANEVLKLLNADIDPRTPIKSLSIAEQRLVSIARSLVHRAKIIILDEPSASLTKSEIETLFTVIQSLSESGVSIIYVSHRLDEIFKIANRVIVMRDGQIVADQKIGNLSYRKLIELITGTKGGQTADERRKKLQIKGRPDTEELLWIKDTTKIDCFEDVSFSLREGEILGIAGLVGSGRTELVRCIFGADQSNKGQVFISGEKISLENPRDALSNGIVLLPEDRRSQGAYPQFSIRENIVLPSLQKFRLFKGIPIPRRDLEKKAAKTMMHRLAIQSPDEEKLVKWLSGGNQQKVVLAKWLQYGARIFLFDEPTLGIDVEAKEEIYKLMEELSNEGKGIIFISSEFPELVAVCNRSIVLREGKIVADLDGDELTEDALVYWCYANNQDDSGLAS